MKYKTRRDWPKRLRDEHQRADRWIDTSDELLYAVLSTEEMYPHWAKQAKGLLIERMLERSPLYQCLYYVV